MATDTKEARALAKTADDGEASRDGLQELVNQSWGWVMVSENNHQDYQWEKVSLEVV